MPCFLTWSFGTIAILLAKRQAHVGLHVGDEMMDGHEFLLLSIYSHHDVMFTGEHKKEDS